MRSPWTGADRNWYNGRGVVISRTSLPCGTCRALGKDAARREDVALDAQEILEAAIRALGVENVVPSGAGGQKWVFRAQLAKQDVMVKVVPIAGKPNAEVVLERASREVELLAAVDSEHVVRVLSDVVEIGEGPEAVAWVEEYLDGKDLSMCMSEEWSDDRLQTLLEHVASGLDACHRLEVVHRDLSPGNVRCLSDGRYVLMDPGFARHLNRLALTGQFQPGTLGYRSPEHVPGGSPIPASDIFALGILAFQTRTNTLPISIQGTEDEYFYRLAHEQAPSITSLDPFVAPKIAEVIDTCLQRQPARRYLDGAELLADLRGNE